MTEKYKVVDLTGAAAFLNLLTGDRPIGSDSDGDPLTRPISLEIKAHLQAVLGERCPGDVYIRRYTPVGTASLSNDDAIAMATYLRSVADAIDPPKEIAE